MNPGSVLLDDHCRNQVFSLVYQENISDRREHIGRIQDDQMNKQVIPLILALSLLVIPVLGEEAGKVFGSIPRNGINVVTLDNSQNDKEAIVLFRESNWPIPFVVSVKPQQTGTLHLPSKEYQVYYALGNGWDNSQKKFLNGADYYQLAGIFNASSAGTVHNEKTPVRNIVYDEYTDAEGIHYLTTKTDPAEWTWAESTINLSGSDDNGEIMRIEESEFPKF